MTSHYIDNKNRCRHIFEHGIRCVNSCVGTTREFSQKHFVIYQSAEQQQGDERVCFVYNNFSGYCLNYTAAFCPPLRRCWVRVTRLANSTSY